MSKTQENSAGRLDWQALRESIPVIKDYIYLDSAAVGPMHPLAFEAVTALNQDLYKSGGLKLEGYIERIEACRALIAKLWNVKPQEICFVSSSSMAVSIITLLLEKRLKKTLKGISLEDEFPTTTFPFLHRGHQLSFVDSHQGEYRAEDYDSCFAQGADFFAGSFILSSTGYRQNLSELVSLIDQHHLISILNVTQGFGVFPFDASQFDFCMASIHKWMMAGMGMSVLKISEEYLEDLPLAGWLSNTDPWSLENRSFKLRKEASACELGISSLANIVGLKAVLEFYKYFGGFEAFEHRVTSLVSYAYEKMEKLAMRPAFYFRPHNRSGIIFFDHSNAEDKRQDLLSQNIICSARKGRVRMAIHWFNNEEDIDYFLKAFTRP